MVQQRITIRDAPQGQSQPETPHHRCAVSGRARTSWRLFRNKEAIDVALKATITISSLIALRDGALAGAGFGHLTLAFDNWMGVSIPVSIVYPSVRFLSAQLRGFIEILVERVQERRFLSNTIW